MFFKKRSEENYIKSINKNGIFENEYSDALPQTVIADIVSQYIFTGNKQDKKGAY